MGKSSSTMNLLRRAVSSVAHRPMRSTTLLRPVPSCRHLAANASVEQKAEQKDPLQNASWWQRKALAMAGYHGQASTRIRYANHMYDNCLKRSDDPQLIGALDVNDTFLARFECVSLHVWMCLVRLRMEGDEGRLMSQELFDNFWDDMVNEIRHKGIKELSVNKHLVELQERFFGAALAYDEALTSAEGSDKLLAAALWRNLYSGDAQSAQHITYAVKYTRSQLDSLCKLPTETFIRGSFKWDGVDKAKLIEPSGGWLSVSDETDRRAPFTEGTIRI